MWHIYKIVKQNENQNENIWYFLSFVDKLWVAFLKCHMYIYIYIYNIYIYVLYIYIYIIYILCYWMCSLARITNPKN